MNIIILVFELTGYLIRIILLPNMDKLVINVRTCFY
uniref:Uncharacterized protein n=1 Tax=Anguilla anguilla TaxID=7936 RepID=A0A0E9U733_ANGAN